MLGAIMAKKSPMDSDVLSAIRRISNDLGHPPSQSEFLEYTEITEEQILEHFADWDEASRLAGLKPHPETLPPTPEKLLADWAKVVRKLGHIPTPNMYQREGSYKLRTIKKEVGTWPTIIERFREFAQDTNDWSDVLSILPGVDIPETKNTKSKPTIEEPAPKTVKKDLPPKKVIEDPTPKKELKPMSHTAPPASSSHVKLDDRPVFGDPISFRGLRHAPVNESGVVFIFGMVAQELGYSVEVIQAGFPNCEARRKIGTGKWQRVRIEFEYESNDFPDKGHPADGCDLIVCWNHNWTTCPEYLEVLELASLVETLED